MHQDHVARAGNIWVGLKSHMYNTEPNSVHARGSYAPTGWDLFGICDFEE